MNDALLIVDVFNGFDHEDGASLLASFRAHASSMALAIGSARDAGIPVVYVNDQKGRWDSDAPSLVRDSISDRTSGPILAPLVPTNGDRFLLKPRYSAFDHTPLVLLLKELEVERVLFVGAATEGCIVQSAIDARELGFKATILADACATNDTTLCELALAYATRVGGIRVGDTASLGRSMEDP